MSVGAAIAAAFLGLASLLVWMLIGSGAHWPAKLVAIILTPGVAFMIWKESRPLTGWPTKTTPPADAVFVSGTVEEPSQMSRGAIYLWLTRPGETKPRAYALPYSRPLHEQVQAALQGVKRGDRVGVRKVRASARRSGVNGGRSGQRSTYEAYRLPPPKAGPKNKAPSTSINAGSTH